jgi:mono/diheme cytochrome c family protein
MLRTATRVFVGVLSGLGVLSIAVFIWLVSTGMSARRTPSAAETWIGARVRSLAIPASDRRMRNPAPPATGTGALKPAMEHFADHCAVCHANDGSGQADVGRGLYPRPPDMRGGATQSLTDGEIFHIINEGVRFTGMPAGDHGAGETWALVAFIRHLPALSKAELEQMRGLNPRSAGDRRGR